MTETSGSRGKGQDKPSGLDLEKAVKKARKFSRPYAVGNGRKFRLEDVDPGDTAGFGSEVKPEAREALTTGVETLAKLQDVLYAQDRWAVLLIFQAMDAAGKDGAIKHVMSGVNPQGCRVASFKAPSAGELDHDFLWRCNEQLPGRGQIGIFNRSYYEDVLIVKVHPELLENGKLPPRLITRKVWKKRYRDIRSHERYLANNGTVIRKFFLHVSRAEQKRRFLERIETPGKNWKFSVADVTERAFWKDYMKAYEEMIRETSTEESPWYVVPADNKWFTRLVVAAAVVDALDSLGLRYPTVDDQKRRELATAKRTLLAGK